jgi:hypothetical protein
MIYSVDDLHRMRSDLALVQSKRDQLTLKYVYRSYSNPRAAEYATQGFVRRISTLSRCITKVFTLVPPEQERPPTKETKTDAEINLQAFTFNLYGALDNLAWVWVHEKAITGPGGRRLNQTSVGLGVRYLRVRNSFSADFRDYLSSFDSWFEYLDEFRHALAHRIALYIPPYSVTPDRETEYRSLQTQLEQAMRRQDFAEYDRLNRAQDELGSFRPVILHSFEESSGTIGFHAQLLIDFKTISNIGEKMLSELDRQT